MPPAFRSSYAFPSDISWFPGHMTKALKTVKNICGHVDMLVEVRDARIPFSSINREIEATVKNKPRLILFHRSDLISRQDQKRLIQHYKDQQMAFLLTSTKTRSNMNAILPTLLKIKPSKFTTVGSYFVVMGIPNVGKSSIIGHLQKMSSDFHKKKSPTVGAIPGVTKQVSTTKIHNSPDVYLLDTPGIFLPSIDDPEVGMKLAICGSIKDSVVGEGEIADYLLYRMNRDERMDYVNVLQLDHASDSIDAVMN